jgi:hypothetical protein
MSSCACFGPNDAFFFNSPKAWYFSGLPDAVMAILSRQPKIRDVNEMALGPGGTYAVVYQNHEGAMMLGMCNIRG